MRLDHVSYAATREELPDVVRRLGTALGTSFEDGGVHPRFGTTNYVLPLANGSYLEVVAALDHPSADRAVFGQLVRRTAEAGGGWMTWGVAVDDIAPIEQRLGRAAVDGRRRRPDGVELSWKQIGLLAVGDDPELPFFTQWLIDPAEHPAMNADRSRRLVALELSGNPATITAWLGAPPATAFPGITFHWVDDADAAGIVAIHIETPAGTVRLT